jgi:hypothetical protein
VARANDEELLSAANVDLVVTSWMKVGVAGLSEPPLQRRTVNSSSSTRLPSTTGQHLADGADGTLTIDVDIDGTKITTEVVNHRGTIGRTDGGETLDGRGAA